MFERIRRRRGWRAALRAGLPIAVLAVMGLMAPAGASAATTYYVTAGGTGTDCTQVDPCGTIADALTAHRVAPAADDVIDIGPGTFVENVAANDPADQGLTIRGTLGSGGVHQTTIRGTGAGDTSSCLGINGCAVTIGASPNTAVLLRDLNVDTEGADSDVTSVSSEGGSDLTNVHVAAQPGADPYELVDFCDDPGVVVDHVTVDASGTNEAGGITTIAGVTIRDSHVITDDAVGVDQLDPYGTRIKLIRTWIENSAASGAPGVVSTGGLTLDSSLITGGQFGAFFDGANGGEWVIQSSTIDVGMPGEYDTGLPDLLVITPGGGRTISVRVNSSLLAEEIQGGQCCGTDPRATFTCSYSDIQLVDVVPPATADCDPGVNGNTQTDPADQFVGGSPFDWRLAAAAPAIDTGQPGPVTNFSKTDLAGAPRRQPGTAGSCPNAIRDMGAYERGSIPCNTKLPSITNGAAPVVGTRLSSATGRWTGRPTSYQWQWVLCDADGVSNCSSIPSATASKYKPVAGDAGHTLRVAVIATNAFGDSDVATSAPSGVVTP